MVAPQVNKAYVKWFWTINEKAELWVLLQSEDSQAKLSNLGVITKIAYENSKDKNKGSGKLGTLKFSTSSGKLYYLNAAFGKAQASLFPDLALHDVMATVRTHYSAGKETKVLAGNKCTLIFFCCCVFLYHFDNIIDSVFTDPIILLICNRDNQD